MATLLGTTVLADPATLTFDHINVGRGGAFQLSDAGLGAGLGATAGYLAGYAAGLAAALLVPPPVATPPSITQSATPRTLRGGALDMLLDPVTLDFIDTPDGEWRETADSRTIVLIMLETELARSYSAPGDGTRLKEFFEAGEPVTASFVESEYRRAMRILEAAGVITDFTMRSVDDKGNLLVDARTGRFTPELHWIDLATGSPVDLVYAPL